MLVLASSMVMIWFNGHDVVTSGTKTKHINTRGEGGRGGGSYCTCCSVYYGY